MVIAFEKVASIYNGKTPARSEQRSIGHPVLKIKDVDANGIFRGIFGSFVDDYFVKTHAVKKIKAGDVMILNAAHNADYVGSKLFFAEEIVSGAIPTGEWLIIRSDPTQLLPRYCYFWLLSENGRTDIKNSVRGIHLYPADVRAIDIPLPPLPEQQRLVRILDEADTLRQRRARADSRTKDFIPALFNEMFGDPIANSKKWERVQVSEALDLINGRAFKPTDWGKVGLPIVRIQNLHDPKSPFNYYAGLFDPKHLVHPGDLLLSWSGQLVSFGVFIWPSRSLESAYL